MNSPAKGTDSQGADSTVTEQRLSEWIALARQASQRAYAPYSNFHVGAVVISGSGREYCACNVENASYGLACCAERNAIFQMVASGETTIETIVIYTPTDKPTAPCGACRQVINEFGVSARIISACQGDARIDTTLDQLFPVAFGPKNLT